MSIPPDGYSILYIDLPWKFSPRNNPNTKFGKGATRYPTLTDDEICALPIKDIAADNAALFLWCVSSKTDVMPRVMQSFGFRFVTKAFVWVKVDKKGEPRGLPGYYKMSNSEDCWLGIRGKMKPTFGVREPIISRIGLHSRKPACVRDNIVRIFGDLPRIELFATERVDGWDALGDALTGRDIREELAGMIAERNGT